MDRSLQNTAEKPRLHSNWDPAALHPSTVQFPGAVGETETSCLVRPSVLLTAEQPWFMPEMAHS